MHIYNKLFSYVKKEKWLAYFAIALTIASTLLTVSAYYFMHEFLYDLIIVNNTNKALYYACMIIGFLIGGSIIYLISVLLTHVLGFRLETNLRKRGIDGLMNASFKFFDIHSSGRTRKIIDDNAAQTHNIVAHLIPDLAGAVLTPIFVLIIGFMIDMKIGIVLILFSILGISQVFSMSGDRAFLAGYQESLEKMNSESVEYIRGMQVIKIFGASVFSFKALHKSIIDYSKLALNYSMSCRKAYLRFQLLLLGSIAILTPFVVLFMDLQTEPKLIAVHLIMILFLSGILFAGFMKIMYVAMHAFNGVSAVDKLEQIFSEMKKDSLNYGVLDTFDNYDIEFDQVSFGYTEEMILENFSFTLETNKSYALIGDSGSGKSTIAKLISGFYPVQSGQIKIGGKNITEYSEDALVKSIAFVFQNSQLFKMSIFDNVHLAKPTATKEEVMHALHLAGCDTLIEKFKQKENTVIGAKGVFLSGGEKQRIAIARAILKDAAIIIMDEASAAIDPENEHELQKAFKNLMHGKTVIMIAHRLSSIRSVDEILVMEKGKIIERGSDAELMNKDGKYQYFQNLYAEANDWRVCHEETN